jgi:hypothetical protein
MARGRLSACYHYHREFGCDVSAMSGYQPLGDTRSMRFFLPLPVRIQYGIDRDGERGDGG